MKIIPYDKFQIKSDKSKDEIINILNNNIEPVKLFRFGAKEKYFQGKFSDNSFQINRIIMYRNSFLPQIKGNISNNENESIVDIRMTLHPFILVFMFMWFFGVFIGCFFALKVLIIILLHGYIQGSQMIILIPLLLLIFGIALVTIPFNIEHKKAKDYLIKIFT